MANYPGYSATIKIGGAPVTLTNAACSDIATTRITYQITDETKRVLSRDDAVTVETSPDGTTWTAAAAGTFTVDRILGQVTFATARPVGTQVRISGKYVPLTDVANANEWSFKGKLDLQDVTSFADNGYKSSMPTLISGSADCKRFDDGLSTFFDLWNNRKAIFVECFIATGVSPIKFWAYVSGDDLSASVNGAITDSLTFEATGEIAMG